MTTVSAHQARRQFAALLELAFYKNAQIRIERNKKPMARLVGEPFMVAIEDIIKQDPALADTLTIMANPEIQAVLEEDKDNTQAVPFDKSLLK